MTYIVSTPIETISKVFESSALLFGQLDKQMNLKLISQNYPNNWLPYYCEQQYYYRDPVLHNLKNNFKTVVWSEITFRKAGRLAQNIYNEARTYGIYSGFCFRFNDTTLISFISSKTDKDYRRYLKLEQHRIVPMLFMVHNYLSFHQQMPEQTAQLLLEVILEFHRKQQQKQRSLEESLYFMQALTNEVSTTLTLFPRLNLLPLCRSACERLEQIGA